MSTRRRDARARRGDDATTRDDDGGGGEKRRDDDDARRDETRGAIDASRATDADVLDAVLRPRTTMAAASAARARMLAAAGDAGDASARGERDAATTCVALGVACELLPHCARACEEILTRGAFDGVVGAVHAKTRGMEASETSAATRALEAIWRACPSTRERFDWSSATRWLRAESDEVRYNACALVALALGVSAKGLDAMRRATTRDDEAFHEYGARREARNLEFANARAMFWLHPGRVRASGESAGADDEDFLGAADLSRVDDFAAPAKGYVRVGGVELRRRGADDASSSGREQKPPMIYTESARRNLAAVALALCRNRPVLLEGPAGCGKSAALEEVARVTGNGDFVTLHLDAQTDSKSLLGAYVCGAAPGEFKWQPGALTQAVTRGVWVLIEDVDLAPFEVLSALVPLLEKRRLYVPGRGESIQAAPGFQLFGSITTEAGRSTSASADPLSGLWTRVVVEPPRGDEATAILCGLYPNLAPLAQSMLATVRQVQSLCGQGGAAAGEAAGLGEISEQDVTIQEATSDDARFDRAASGLEAQANDVNHALARVHAGRPFTLRDLIRWARRIQALRRHELALLQPGKAAPPQLRAAAYEEAADVLAGMLPAGPGRRRVLKMIAATWGLPAEDTADATDRLHKPTIQESHQSVTIGRCALPVGKTNARGAKWSRTGHASRLLERTAAAVQLTEPVLLVGETGTGKTALVQELARLTGAPLTVVNLSNQSESADFLGGFKPVSARHLCLPLLPKFHNAFNRTFPSASNAEFLTRISRYAEKKKWTHLLHAFRAGVERVAKLAAEAAQDAKSRENTDDGKKANKRRKTTSVLSDDLVAAWRDFERDLSVVEHSTNASKNGGPVFAFVEGALITALREGHWILLDEINLAPAETLERLGGILESESGSIVLSERGDGEPIPRHPRFRLFGAMNPATDVGKRDLPTALKHRFVEIYAGETEGRDDLAMIVDTYLHGVPGVQVDDIVDFYIAARQAAHTTLLDSADQKPQYSLRTLSRACEYVRAATGIYGLQRALFDGFAMSFLTLLKTESGVILEKLMVKHLLRGTALKAMKTPPNPPAGDTHVLLEHFWVEAGDLPRVNPEEGKYVVTETVRGHLSNLARAVLLRRHPILLQGPTSSGKTSLVEYLAHRTGHRFMRINNHEHTDLQEYLGTYVTDETGQLVFQEGALVQAVRKGYWVVLDELNLAPTDVLEALNRLLDDNRELFVPELQETIRPHPHFMLFATQNPPGAVYGGRKVLSKAFRNRFMELHIGDIPDEELKTILHTRCEIAPSYCVKLVEVMRELQRRRQGSRAFAGKDGYITARDLFRWANRQSNGYEALAADGFRVLGERLRSDVERHSIREVLEKYLKVPPLIESTLYASAQEGVLEKSLVDAASQAKKIGGVEAADAAALADTIAWTPAMRRLFALVEGCMNHKEPALLVGETGCGKTSVCQLLALLRGQKLRILNCHQHTETSDFIGGFRPTRTSERQEMMDEGKTAAPFAWEDGPLIKAMRDGDILLVDEVSLAEDSVLERLNSVLEPGRSITLPEKGGAEVEELAAHPNFLILGTMNPGGDFGKKELSPALRNRFTEVWIGSVGKASEMENIVAKRMSQVSLAPFPRRLAEFWEFYHDNAGSSTARAALAVRDLIGWANFMREMVDPSRGAPLSPSEAYAHGAYLTLLDGLGLGLGMPEEAARQIKIKCLSFLQRQLPEEVRAFDRDTMATQWRCDDAPLYLVSFRASVLRDNILTTLSTSTESSSFMFSSKRYFTDMFKSTQEHETLSFAASPEGSAMTSFEVDADGLFGVAPFKISCGHHAISRGSFELSAPSTKKNAARIMRAMQLSKPILLEGSPGVGKTSIVSALAAASGHKLVRLNLSEQTDMMDLLGADLPAASGAAGEFVWSDGAFLAALKAGDWVLLDELNLAPQPVLEGLNAVLDHRAEVFVPELGQTFKCPPSFRVFAAQNPVQEGGGRKGLPKSFLNRFTRVHVEPMCADDLKHISRSLHPSIPAESISAMVRFNASLAHAASIPGGTFARAGSPWEFNLRDVLRWCDLAERSSTFAPHVAVERLFGTLFVQRLRTYADRERCEALFKDAFGYAPPTCDERRVYVDADHLCIGDARVICGETKVGNFDDSQYALLPGQYGAFEAVAHCVQRGWMSILVGSAASGKTTIVQMLASLSGNRLRQAALTAATDTSELLGSFEQRDPSRDRAAVEEDIFSAIKAACGNHATWSNIDLFDSMWTTWERYKVIMQRSVDMSGGDSYTALLDVLKALYEVDAGARSLRLKERVENVGQPAWAPGPSPDAGKFEWVDGVLLNAVISGEWVLLENANLCSPTVLDRLNPLLEPEGFLLVNECGLIDGQPRIVKAHPNFRLFLAIDPRHGEVSRAMRNRGVEVFLLPPERPIVDEKNVALPPPLCMPPPTPTVENDIAKILESIGIPGGFVQTIMIAAHVNLGNFVSKPGMKGISSRDIVEWATLTLELLSRGHDVRVALSTSWSQVYMRGESSAVIREAARDAFKAACEHAFSSLHNISTGAHAADDATARSVMLQPMCWPNISIMNETLSYNAHDVESKHRAQTALFEGVIAQVAGQLASTGDVHSLSPLIASALPVASSMRRIGFDSTLDETDAECISKLSVTLNASAQRILDVAIANDDSQNFNGIVARLSAFARVSNVSSMTTVSDELSAVLNALDIVAKHSFVKSVHVADSSLRSLIVRGVLQKAKTELHVRHVNETVNLGAPSCLQLSIWRSQDQVARARAAPVHACVDVASVLLGSCARFEDDLLRLVCTIGESLPREHFNLLREFQDWRIRLEQLTMTTRGDSFKIDPASGCVASADVVETIAVAWTKVREAFAVVLENWSVGVDSCSLITEQLQSAAAIMDEALEIPPGKPIDPLLWKYAGRPSLPKTSTLFDMEKNVRDICHALQVRSTFASDLDHLLTRQRFGGETSLSESTFAASCAALGAGVGLRSAALEGLCFFAWTHIQANADISTSSEMEVEAGEIPRLLGLKCADRAKTSGVAMEISMDDENSELRERRHISDLPAQELLKSIDKDEPWKLGAIADVAVPAYPALGFPAWALKWEAVARLHSTLNPIAELWSISSQSKLLSQLTARLMTERDGKVMSKSEAMLAAQGVTFGIAASPRSPADFVAHRHLLWLYGDASGANASEKSQGLAEHLHDMWLRWHASQWDNAIDGVPRALLPKAKADASSESTMSSFWASASGPIRFERATATAFVSGIVTDANIGCAERLPRMVQLRMASRLLRFERANPVHASIEDWISLAGLTAQMLLSHVTLLEDGGESATALVNAVDAMMKLVSDGAMQTANEAARTIKMLKTACAHLCDAYSPLAAMREAVLEPLIVAVCEGASHKDVVKSATLSGDSGARDKGRRGAAWALLGVLRLNLLLPAGLSDPAVTVRTELWHLDTTLEREVQPLIGVITWHQRTPSAPSGDAQSLVDCVQLGERLSSERERLRTLALPRPTPSRWAALRRVVVQFREGLASAQRLLQLLQKCSALKPDETTIMEAETWLGSSAQWSSLLDDEYSSYRDMTQPLQLAVYEIRRGVALAAEAARARMKNNGEIVSAAVALFSFPTVVNAAYEGSAALMLSEDRVLRALSSAENAAAAHLPSNPKSGDLELGALRVALTSALSEARREGALSMKSWQRLSKCFAAFSALYDSCREEDAEADRLATEIFKQATKGPSSYESTEANDQETEERAYRIAFKDFAAGFADFKDAPDAPLMLEHDCVEDEPKSQEVDDEVDITRAARLAGILEGELAEELVNVHYAALATLRGAPAHSTEESLSAQEKIVQSMRLTKYGKYVRNLNTDEALRASEFARSYDTGISVLKASQLSLPVAVDYASRFGHSLRVALEYSAVSRPALSVDTLGTSPYESQATPEEEEALRARTKRSQAELDEDAAADALDDELTVGGCPGEMALIVPPVAAARRRLTQLLDEWPEHPLLTQLAELCDRMLSLPLLGPVKAGLTGIELLLARAQIWEESSAEHTSLKNELNECAKLALRWRAREVRTWPRLLARCSERHASRAKRTWFAIYRLLSSMKSRALSGDDAPEDEIHNVDVEKIRSLTVALEEYLQGSTIGEFETRLELIWCFFAELEVETRACKARGASTSSHDDALCAVLYNIWRYYSQFSSVVDKHIETIRKPCEIKLRDHAKLAKWEDRGYHAMKVQGEANQRSLHKFVRAFDTALNGLVLPVLETAASQTGFKELSVDDGTQTQTPILPNAAKPSKEELEAVKLARQAEIDTMRQAELESLRLQRDAWNGACAKASARTKNAVETSSRVAQQIRKEYHPAAIDVDETSYRARLPSLVKRMGTILDRALNGEDGYDVRTAGAESLDDFAVTIAKRANALRDDKAAKKAIKKKAFQDLLKTLPAMGIKHSRGAVPVEYRAATMWFMEKTMKEPRCLAILGEDATNAFRAADKYYYRSMARIQRLWLMRGAQNPDLTSREVEIATLSCEHLLHILRTQRSTISAAAGAEADIDIAYSSLNALSAHGNLPSQRFAESWLIEQRDIIDRFATACVDVSLLNRAISAAEPLSQVKPTTAAVVTALTECKDLAHRARARLEPFLACTLESVDIRVGNDRPSLEPWRLNAVASSDAVAAIQANFDDFKRVKKLLASAQVEAEVRLTTGDIGMHGANAVPGWDFLRSIVDLDVTRFEKDFTNGVSPGGENVAGDVVSISKRIGKLSENIETVVQSTLIWVQGVDASSKPIMIKREIVAEGEDEEEEAEGSMTTYEAAVGGAMNPKRLEHIVHAVRNVVNDVKSIVDEAHAIDDRDVSNFVAARAGTVAPLLGLLRSAVRTVLFEYINFHKSSCKLESVLTALFLGLSVEGFCIPPEEADGEAGGGMMDDQSGTGMGAGEGEKDVADEIENEDQILGMEDLEKEEEDHKDKGGGEEEEDGGIEMQNDFEGVMEDVDAGGDDEDEDDPREDMEKEMGEDGDDGDVIDERMWNDEDDKDDEKNEAPEKYEKGSSVKQDEKQETETRAAEEDDDGPPKDPDQGEESGEDEKDRPKENDQSGAPDANDDGKQNEEEVEENHGKNPSLPEPEEFELDDLKLEEEDEQGEDAEDDANDESMQNEDAEELDGAPPEDVNADEQNENADGEMNEDGDGGLTDDVMDVDDDEVAQADDEEEGATDHLQDDAIAADDAMDEDGEEGGPQGQGDGGGGDQDVNETQGQGGEAGANAQGSDGQGEEETKQQAHGAMDTDVNEGNDGRQLPLPQSSTDIPSAGADGEGTGAGASGGEGTVAPMTGGPASDGDKKTPPPPQRQQDANPHRSLGDALKSWRERLNVVGDAAENDTAGDQGGDDGGGEGDEYEFERAAEKGGVDDEDGKGNKGIQTLGNATEEQATKNSLNDVPEESEDEDEEGLEPMEMRQDSRVDATDEGDQGPGNDDEREDDGASAAMKRQRKSSEPKKDIASTDAQTAAIDGEEADEDETMTERELVAGGEGETGEESTIALQLEHTSLGGAGEVVHELTPEDVELARIEAEQSLTQWREKSAKERGNEANAQNLWRKLEQLTTALSAELAEKLRLILEPTLASRLQGDYKTGKRLNMRKIIPYIASDFRKDKIWLRRSRPSARKYQVMLAIDDSRSMAENHCGHIALESMVLLARAMARLEVGEIGVVGFGAGANAVRTLHPLGAPFTDQEGPSLVSKLSFAEDNTLADRPMVQLLETMAARLSVAREQIRGGGTKLQQLVLIIADGRFHEKEALRRCMREVGAQRGLLVAFIVLDNPQNSLLNMQSVSFTGGKPVMKKYLDSFPFPFYVLVQDVSQLPATISDLLRQWFEMATSHD